MRRNTKTMYEWRKAYRDKEELMLERGFPEVSPHEFYRDLFPEGSLQSAEHDGKGNLIATQIRPSGKGRTKQWVVDDSLNMLDKVIGDEFGLIPPITFYGKIISELKQSVELLKNSNELLQDAISDEVGSLKDEVKENTVQEVRKALQANIEAIQRATKLLEKQSDTLTSVMKQKIRELEESKNSFFRYEGLKLYLFWGGMVCNILVFLMLAYSLFGK